MSLQSDQAPIDRRIVEELIDAIPEAWEGATLVAAVRAEGGAEKLTIEILDPEGNGSTVSPNADLIQALYDLLDCFRRHGRAWASVRYAIAFDEEGDCDFKAEFTY